VYDRGEGRFLQDSLAAFILAGGKSTRMGADKAFVLLDGRTLLAMTLEVTCSVTTDVSIVGDRAKFSAYAPVVEDIFRDCGPLGGIHSALQASKAELNLILAVDVPFVSSALLKYLLARAHGQTYAAVTLPSACGRLQPLCAIYRRSFAAAAERALRAGQYKIGEVLTTINTQIVTEDELVRAGFAAEMFRNLNTQTDLEAAASTVRSEI
jgi:molybdopterin-guanine dinucleotide biosynthesis protein A